MSRLWHRKASKSFMLRQTTSTLTAVAVYGLATTPQGTAGAIHSRPGKRLSYTFNPTANLTEAQSKLIMGGEHLLWTEQSGPSNLDPIVWPRGATSAELWWSGAGGNVDTALPTLQRRFVPFLAKRSQHNPASAPLLQLCGLPPIRTFTSVKLLELEKQRQAFQAHHIRVLDEAKLTGDPDPHALGLAKQDPGFEEAKLDQWGGPGDVHPAIHYGLYLFQGWLTSEHSRTQTYIIDALLFHYFGATWQVQVRKIFLKLFHSKAWKTTLTEMPEAEKQHVHSFYALCPAPCLI
ncbi:glycoside hydrolase family 20 protein [Amanita muscaria Koide BX008]|uniref:beta-N-acetylhexosaminidase n=1 Tax=Amanita muscaria (strain Koide BX008) TaxID=946122 RepID=A0A0C2XFU7_AMAMK|nr:glycoside hydrolase family 20 protein [Amanita muscaria Koide BX008]